MNKTTSAILGTGVVIVVVAAAVVALNPDLRRKIFGSSDEDSIRVRGGSMHIDTNDGIWTPDGSDWRNETPAKKVHKNDLWLAVTYNNGAAKCKAAAPGHPIIIRYSDAGVQAHFNPAGNPVRTKVTLTGSWTRESSQKTLSHGTAGQGNIAEIKVNGADPGCDLTPATLDRIFVCSSSSDANCR